MWSSRECAFFAPHPRVLHQNIIRVDSSFFLLPKMKNFMKRGRYDNVEVIEWHSGRKYPEDFYAVKAVLGKMYCHLRKIFRREYSLVISNY